MAFKLDKGDLARRDRLKEELVELRGKLEDAISEYNAAQAALQTPVNEALTAYNEAVEETRGFVEDTASTADAEFEDKSEKWQEGERGQSAREWIDAWQSAEFDAVEVTFPDELSLPDEEFDHDGRLENLPEAAGES